MECVYTNSLTHKDISFKHIRDFPGCPWLRLCFVYMGYGFDSWLGNKDPTHTHTHTHTHKIQCIEIISFSGLPNCL